LESVDQGYNSNKFF